MDRRKANTELYSRNWAFISSDLQERMASTTLFFAGLGLGSVIAELAVRTGIENFILADGDKVELSNLNRQAYDSHNLWENKARATAGILSRINKNARIQIIDRFLEKDDLAAPIADCDFVINTIDFDHPALIECNRLAGEMGKTVLFPMNIGWGGTLIVFTPDSESLEKMGGITDAQGDLSEQLKKNLVLRAVGENIPPYLASVLAGLLSPRGWPYDPQLGAASSLTAALAIRTLLALIAGEKVRTSPEAIRIDIVEPIHGVRNGETAADL